MKHLLIDFESVQPSDLNTLNTDDVYVWLFLAPQQQQSLPLGLCESLCRFGGHVRFVRVQSHDNNALSMYLGFCLGEILTKEPQAEIAILSNNALFDGLVSHVHHQISGAEMVRASDVLALPEYFCAAKTVSEAIHTETTAQLNEHQIIVLEKYYPIIVQAMGQKDAYHPRHRRNLAANIERFLSQYGQETEGQTEILAEQVIIRLKNDGHIKDLGDGLLSYHFVLTE